ncbi:MAG: hypothetical protein NW241_22635 [Bacteroidia bacterium]|nr:hypothetical protein [Bacteroidia bacterium]
MEHLIQLLSHPYLVLNHVAETVYEAEGAAVHQRLRSRVKGRHRFLTEEYKAIRKQALGFSRKLDRMAEKLLEAQADGARPDATRLMQHAWLNHKEVLEAVGAKAGLSYYQTYDRLRNRLQPAPETLQALAGELTAFAQWVRERLDAAQEESKAYAFSQGRGGASHQREAAPPARKRRSTAS